MAAADDNLWYSSSPNGSSFYDNSFIESQSKNVNVKKNHHAIELLAAMKDMKDESDLIDLNIQVGNRIVKCHKALLVAGSPYYDDNISGEVNQETLGVVEKVLGSDIVHHIINYIYTGSLLITKDNASNLLQACYQHNIFRGKAVESAVSDFLARQTLNTCKNIEESEYKFDEFHFASEILKILNQQRSDEMLTDIVIAVGDQEFPCHKFVLAATSAYFKAMFSSKMRETYEGTVSLEGLHPSIMKILVNFTYTGKLTINCENVQEILRTACYLQHQSAMAACTEFVKDELHPSNCLGILQFAITVGCQQLCETAMAYSLHHFVDLQKFEEFKETTFQIICQLIDDDDLNVPKEEDVYTAVMMWIEYDSENRQYFLSELLKRIRLTLVDASFMEQIENDPLILGCPCAIQIVNKIKNLRHALHKGEKVRDRRMKLRFSMKTEILVTVCGFTDNQQWVRNVRYYNPDNGLWNELAPFPGRNQRFQCVAVDNDIYVIGGQADHHAAHLSETLSDVWKYSSITDTWTQVTSLNKPRHGHGAAVLNGKIYVVGGKIGWSKKFNDVERYDPQLNIWTTIGRIKGHFVEKPTAVAHDGKLYIKGYFYRDPDMLYCFDPSTNTWSQTIVNHCIHGDGVENAYTINDHIYYLIYRGFDNCISAYHVPSSTHVLGSVMPGGKYLHSYGMSNIGQNIVVTGGSRLDAGINIPYVDCYNPEINSWIRIAVMPLPLCEHGCVTIHKYIPNFHGD
ncbi:kelch-like protein 38 [Saccoglossus kowalevskii]|uniref:Kelch-like protein 21-like n=1 Tax=Saccoglossus kowalevskii TaxID=10224 RepID=A0ABM0N0T8_SACKO|nr:PREDICTED: kelch-like protein 21-like [Saccoglossus kowalevskii]